MCDTCTAQSYLTRGTLSIVLTRARFMDAAAFASAICAGLGGLYGSYDTKSSSPAVLALAFVCVFALALHRVRSLAPAQPPYQIVLILLMICLSFGLHTTYLPAGICCFFTLMLCKNEVLMPRPTQVKRE